MIPLGEKVWAGHSCPAPLFLMLPLLLTFYCCLAGDTSTKPLVLGRGKSKATAADKSVRPTRLGSAGSAYERALARLAGNDAEFLLYRRKALKNFVQPKSHIADGIGLGQYWGGESGLEQQ